MSKDTGHIARSVINSQKAKSRQLLALSVFLLPRAAGTYYKVQHKPRAAGTYYKVQHKPWDKIHGDKIHGDKIHGANISQTQALGQEYSAPN